MRRRSVCALLFSGASVAALAACGGGSTLLDTQEEPAPAKEEAKAEPTAAPKEAEATAEPEAKAEPEPTAAPELDLPNLGKAPEITLTQWLNSDAITLSSLEGKASALIVFWTYT